MKIAHLTTHLNMGGIPVYIYTLGKTLHARGIDQIVISSGGSMESDFIKNNIPSFRFNLQAKFEFHPKIFLALPGIIRTLKKEKVDLVHAHTRVGQVVAALIQKQTGIPFVSTCHGIYKPRLGRRLFPAWGEKVIAISEPVRQDLVDTHHVPEDKVRRIRNGIELDHFVNASGPVFKEKARRKLLLSSTDIVLCMVARLVAPKGIGDFLEVVQILAKAHKNVRGLIVGDGPDRTEFEKMAVTLGIGDIVSFTGTISDVSPILAASDIFIHPVRVAEGFGLSIAEAMVMSLPVIVTDQWALLHLMEDRNIGEFVAVESPLQIADIIEKWLPYPEKMRQMGANAKATALELFDIQRMTDEILRVYEESLPGKEPR